MKTESNLGTGWAMNRSILQRKGHRGHDPATGPRRSSRFPLENEWLESRQLLAGSPVPTLIGGSTGLVNSMTSASNPTTILTGPMGTPIGANNGESATAILPLPAPFDPANPDAVG